MQIINKFRRKLIIRPAKEKKNKQDRTPYIFVVPDNSEILNNTSVLFINFIHDINYFVLNKIRLRIWL